MYANGGWQPWFEKGTNEKSALSFIAKVSRCHQTFRRLVNKAVILQQTKIYYGFTKTKAHPFRQKNEIFLDFVNDIMWFDTSSELCMPRRRNHSSSIIFPQFKSLFIFFFFFFFWYTHEWHTFIWPSGHDSFRLQKLSTSQCHCVWIGDSLIFRSRYCSPSTRMHKLGSISAIVIQHPTVQNSYGPQPRTEAGSFQILLGPQRTASPRLRLHGCISRRPENLENITALFSIHHRRKSPS